jgi:hypothetical protein
MTALPSVIPITGVGSKEPIVVTVSIPIAPLPEIKAPAAEANVFLK